MAKSRNCRNCGRRYQRSMQHPGCCSLECYQVRQRYLKNSPKPMPVKKIDIAGLKNEFSLSKRTLNKMHSSAQMKYGDSFYTSRQWLALRYQAIMKYGRVCMLCRASNIEIHVDHIKPRSKFPHLELDINNLQVLCRECNLGKGNT